MNIRLPKKFDKRKEGIEAYVVKGKLYISRYEFERVMYMLTYQLKGETKCYYCGTTLHSGNRTLDHVYPKDYGGISIPNNMVPCCRNCNMKKGNLNEYEYKDLLKTKQETPELTEAFLKNIGTIHYEIRTNKGINLPQKWYHMQKDYDVLAQLSSVDRYKTSKAYLRVLDLYETYGKICKPVVISDNNIVLDGLMALMLAKNLPEKVEVPFIKLENVIAY